LRASGAKAPVFFELQFAAVETAAYNGSSAWLRPAILNISTKPSAAEAAILLLAFRHG
jgi:hypothetical protein